MTLGFERKCPRCGAPWKDTVVDIEAPLVYGANSRTPKDRGLATARMRLVCRSGHAFTAHAAEGSDGKWRILAAQEG